MADQKTGQELTWQEKKARAEQIVKDNPLYHMVVYVSDKVWDCEPIPFWGKIDHSVHPFVLEAPDDSFTDPVYDWAPQDGSAPHWVEAGPETQAKKLAKVEKTVETLTTTADSLSKTQNQVVKQSQILQQQVIAGQKATMAGQKTQVQMLQMLQDIAAKVGVTPADDSKTDDKKNE